MNSIGEALRRERQRRNLDLEQVARETKINIKLLEAIEAEDFSKLPGGVFAKSFVKQYARLLGLDEEEIAAELQRTIQPPAPEVEMDDKSVPSPPPPLELPRVPDWGSGKLPRSRSPLPALALVVVVMLVCSAIYGWWQKSRRPVEVAQQTPPQAVTTPAPAPPAPAVASPESQASAPVPSQTPDAAPAPSQTPDATPAPVGERSVPSEERQPAPGAPAPAPVPTGNVPSGNAPSANAESSAGNVHVTIQAQEPTWISARTDGREVYSGTLQANEKKDWNATDRVRLVIGNAGGIAVELNGKPVPPLGPRGQVRVVQFSPGGVYIVPPKPPAPGSL